MSRQHATDRPLPWLPGTCALLAGCFLIVTGILEGSDLPNIRMPQFWYTNRPLWWLTGFGLVIFGCFLLSRSSDTRGPVFQSVVLYTRDGCHLCEDAYELLHQHSARLPTVQSIDIDTHPELFAKYDTCVPVIEIDGRLRFRGKVDPVLLQRMIDGAESRAGGSA